MPGKSIIFALEEIRSAVVVAMAIESQVRRALLIARRLDARDPAILGYVGNHVGDVAPSFAAVVRNVDIAVVGADVEQTRLQGRFGDRGDRVAAVIVESRL